VDESYKIRFTFPSFFAVKLNAFVLGFKGLVPIKGCNKTLFFDDPASRKVDILNIPRGFNCN
jgi:hypothetical protein